MWIVSWYFSFNVRAPLGRFISKRQLPPALPYRWYFRKSSDCQGCFLSGKRSGIFIFRKSWMHFSSSSSMESFSFAAFFLLLMFDSREPDVRVLSRSLFRLISDCWISCTGPFLIGLSRVWMLLWRVTGPQITVSWGELASDWLSQLEVERSLQEVPLSPLSPLPFLQQQSQWEEDHLEGSPGRETQNRKWVPATQGDAENEHISAQREYRYQHNTIQ